MSRPTENPYYRWWSFVRTDTYDRCWPWRGSTDQCGYGMFWLNGKTIHASRAYFLVHDKEIPSGLEVCHVCDNPRCVNPRHLYLGTPAQNAGDREDRGRANRPCKLTESKVRVIRGWLQKGIKASSLAQQFGVTYRTIKYIADGITWRAA